MSTYHTLGALAPDLASLDELRERLAEEGVSEESLVALCRRRDEPEIRVALPEARTRTLETSLTRIQRLHLGSTYLGVTAVSVLMGAVHLPTGIAVQAIATIVVIAGLILFHRQPKVRQRVLGLGLPEELAERWEKGFAESFALVLAVVPEERFDDARDAFLETPDLRETLAIDRRPVL